MVISRIENSSCVACDRVVTLCNARAPASISSASWRNAATTLVSFSPKAYLPARLAHSAARRGVLLPFVIQMFSLWANNGPKLVPCTYRALCRTEMPAVVVIRDNDLEQLFRARMVALQPQPLVYAN